MSNIIISGGSGLIGRNLIKSLNEQDYNCSYLTRNPKSDIDAKPYVWDPAKGSIDDDAFDDKNVLIHLAGAGIADKRWTSDRKKELYDSRILSTRFLAEHLRQRGSKLDSVISTSAIGYYGDSGSTLMQEDSNPGDNFLAKICGDWEREAKAFKDVANRLVIVRIGIVLTKEGGALKETIDKIKLGVAAYLGDGNQYYSWIHIEDLLGIFRFSIENPIEGIFNAVAPNPVTNKDFTNSIKDVYNNAFVVLPAPEFVLRIALGEMSSMVLETPRCSSAKIESEGFQFNFRELNQALKSFP